MFENWCGPVSGCGFGTWLYDYQNLWAGAGALAAGIFAFVAAKVQVAGAKDVQTTSINEARKDVVGREINQLFTITSQIQFHLLLLDGHIIEAQDSVQNGLIIGEAFAPAMKSIAHRHEHFAKLVERAWISIAPMEVELSSPAGRMILLADAVLSGTHRLIQVGQQNFRREVFAEQCQDLHEQITDLRRATTKFQKSGMQDEDAFDPPGE